MQRLVFWLVYPLLWLVSRLPFPLFYLFSDVVSFFVYYLIGYRKKTIRHNLELVFPEKSLEERKQIEKKFYRHMVDMFLEMVKSITISNKELKRRFTFTNLEEVEKIRTLDKSIIVACGHYASYEWMNSIQLYGVDYRCFGIYKKIKNPLFDKMARDIRGRFEGELLPTTTATKQITHNESNGIRGIYAMIADQSPKLQRAKAWTDFMGIKVPVFMGTEKLSRDLDMAVVYLQVKKKKRGFYEATFKTISYNPADERDFEITRTYFDFLEKQIKDAPEYYLWTHKRWKHRNASIPQGTVTF